MLSISLLIYNRDIIRLSFHRLSSNMSTTRISIPIGFDEEIMFEHEIEQCRVKMNNQMDEAIERLNKKKDDLNKQIDDRLESHRLYRNQVDSEVKKQQFIKSIKQIKEISASINLLKEPAMLKFECENNIVFSQIDQIGKLVDKESADKDEIGTQTIPCNQIDIRYDETSNAAIEVQRVPFENNRVVIPYQTQPYNIGFQSYIEVSTEHPCYKAVSNKSSRHVHRHSQRNDEIHFTDDPTDIHFNDFSIYSLHTLYIDGKYWESVFHYFNAHTSNYQNFKTNVSLYYLLLLQLFI